MRRVERSSVAVALRQEAPHAPEGMLVGPAIVLHDRIGRYLGMIGRAVAACAAPARDPAEAGRARGKVIVTME